MPEVSEEIKSESEVDENESTKSEPPTKRGKHFVDKLNAYRNIILAVAALATAIGSWFKPTDTTTVKQSFDWTTERVQELSKNDVQMHADIVALRAYLEGMKNSGFTPTTPEIKSEPEPEPLPEPEGQGAGAVRKPVRKPVRRQPVSGAAQPMNFPQGIHDMFVENQNTMMEQFQSDDPQEPAADSTPPELKADPQIMKRPSFDEITE